MLWPTSLLRILKVFLLACFFLWAIIGSKSSVSDILFLPVVFVVFSKAGILTTEGTWLKNLLFSILWMGLPAIKVLVRACGLIKN